MRKYHKKGGIFALKCGIFKDEKTKYFYLAMTVRNEISAEAEKSALRQ